MFDDGDGDDDDDDDDDDGDDVDKVFTRPTVRVKNNPM